MTHFSSEVGDLIVDDWKTCTRQSYVIRIFDSRSVEKLAAGCVFLPDYGLNAQAHLQ